ncbi:MAG TPA: hypothetical protein VN327_06860 [Pseudonocardiaceae bacterium]|jgi:sterol desaturase/sphingolipid hydroxylase (fatty acid hydroxylase superfamily)|nr:hypothetical protein [Pseudonocardiaceae bacterium]
MSVLSSEQDTDEREVQRLQQTIRDQRAALDAAPAGTAAYQSALVAVLEATVRLVNHEAGIPVRRREIYSACTAKIVRRIGLVTAPIVAVVAVLTLAPWLSAWWLLLLMPLLALAVLIAVTASAAAPSDRSTRRRTAVIWAVTVVIDLALIIVSHRLPHWLPAVLMVMATAGGLAAACQLAFDLDAAKSNETDS